MIDITLLGTSSAFPTKERNHPSIYVNLDGTRILLDCGEGTQRQIRKAGLSPAIDKIFLTHWHGDHSLGVGGIIQSSNMLGGQKQLEIFGPKGTTASVNKIVETYKFYSKLKIISKSIDAKRPLLVDKIGKWSVYALNVKHGTSCLGYRLKEDDSLNIKKDLLSKLGLRSGPYLSLLKKGKNVMYQGKLLKAKDMTYLKKGKILTYLTDLSYEPKLSRFAIGSDVLIIEATFLSSEEKKARKVYHLTVMDALKVGKYSGAKKVVLVHQSQRYEGTNSVEEEVKVLKEKMNLKFEVMVGKDLEKIPI